MLLCRSEIHHLQPVRSVRPHSANRGEEEPQNERTGLRGVQGSRRSNGSQEQPEWVPHLREDDGTCGLTQKIEFATERSKIVTYGR